MKRLEAILLSKMPIWITITVVVLTVAGTVMFSAIVEDAARRTSRSTGMDRVALEIARIPKSLRRLFFIHDLALSREQRFDGQAGLDLADTGRSPGGGGYLLLARYFPKPTSGRSRAKVTTLYELIDLSRRKTVHVWHLDPDSTRTDSPMDVLPDGSLVVDMGRYVTRLDACSNVEWTKRLKVHHSIERDADGNLWAPATGDQTEMFEEDELLEFSPSGEVLTRISLSDALARSGYRHLLYDLNRRSAGDSLHVNDVQPVLRDGPFWRRGDLFVSLRASSVVLLYRPATDEVVWLRAGPWLHQHDVDVVSESEISVFSNNTVRASDGRLGVLGANEVYIYDFATGETRSPWREAMRRHDVRTKTMGVATLLGDGGLVVQEHEYGRVLGLSADGARRWSYVNRGSDGQVYRLGWGRYLDAEYGAEVVHSVAVAGCTNSDPPAGGAD